MANYLYINLPAEGHVNPTLGIVKELTARGEKVIYYCSEPFKARIEHAGAEFRRLDYGLDLSPKEKPPYAILRMLERIEDVVDSIYNDIQQDNIDYVIYDANALPGKIIGHLLKKPTISTWSIFAINEKMADRLNALREKSKLNGLIDMDKLKKTLERLRDTYDMALPDFPKAMLCDGDLNIVFTSSFFQMESATFPRNRYVFIGPSITSRTEQDQAFSVTFKPNQPLIYASMGTVLNDQPHFYQTVIQTFKNLPFNIILSVGKNTAIESLGPIPDHIVVQQYVPQLKVLEQADVFVTHCGMNSTNEALYFNVPLVMLPAGSDQPIVADRVEELGAGVQLDLQTLTGEALKNAVITVLNDPKYRQSAKQISASFREAGGYKKGVDAILRFTESYEAHLKI
ncbi:glycosyl transferase [Pullulanibacillus camelliae]|uniref:Glycosyl transferase n=1 Tax=Pullulanibacillus camelliae TaxID=1707096 RepID=A0A8J2YFK9_9BACL|nr:glycosyl transferase [Pullulanibacillus camelliae]